MMTMMKNLPTTMPKVPLHKGTLRKVPFAFFGTAPLATEILDVLERTGYVPSLVIAGPDTIEPRKKTIQFPPEKIWAIAHDVEVVQPKRIDTGFVESLQTKKWDVFVVASYGKILPKALLEIPAHGVLNMHPSLLPRLRGPSPMRSAILNNEKEIGVSVMLLDNQMDHGPIIAQKKVTIDDRPPHGAALDALLAHEGAELLAEYLPRWIAGEVEPHEQNHDLATYCEIFTKEDGLLDLHGDAYKNFLKIRAFEGWPGTYALFTKDAPSTGSTSSPKSGSGQAREIRVKIIDAVFENGALKITRVIPEGKREMSYEDFLRSGATPR